MIIKFLNREQAVARSNYEFREFSDILMCFNCIMYIYKYFRGLLINNCLLLFKLVWGIHRCIIIIN